MKITNHPVLGEIPQGSTITIYFEGQEIAAREGQTVASALMESGVYKLGQSRNLSQARGLYCGNGRCQSCLVTIDGVEHVRSCITPVREKMTVERSIKDPDAMRSDIRSETARQTKCEDQEKADGICTTDVLVIGGGPAGLAAAYEVASRGYRTTIVDYALRSGGQLRHQTRAINDMPAPFAGLRGFEIAEKLEARLKTFGVQILLQHEAVGVFGDGSVGVSTGIRIKKIAAKSIIAATGAAENAVPFPGWTLPGVMTSRAVQSLINREYVLPGKRGIVIGASDTALETAKQLQAAGAKVLGVMEAGQIISEKVSGFFKETGIPLIPDTEVIEATGRGRVQEALLKTGEHTQKYEVDFICAAGALEPVIDIFSVFNCRLAYQEQLGGRLPHYDADFQTSAGGLFVAGRAAGITCQGGVFLTAALAGIGAADYLEGSENDQSDIRKAYWKELERIESAASRPVWQARLEHIKTGIRLQVK